MSRSTTAPPRPRDRDQSLPMRCWRLRSLARFPIVGHGGASSHRSTSTTPPRRPRSRSSRPAGYLQRRRRRARAACGRARCWQARWMPSPRRGSPAGSAGWPPVRRWRARADVNGADRRARARLAARRSRAGSGPRRARCAAELPVGIRRRSSSRALRPRTSRSADPGDGARRRDRLRQRFGRLLLALSAALANQGVASAICSARRAACRSPRAQPGRAPRRAAFTPRTVVSPTIAVDLAARRCGMPHRRRHPAIVQGEASLSRRPTFSSVAGRSP